jgi:RHS repeat-associated protein
VPRSSQFYRDERVFGANDNVGTPVSRSYNSLNRDTGFTYDAAGNVIQDLLNKYLYDAEGRLCAVEGIDTTSGTQYLYDAEGRRVGKGSQLTPTTPPTCPAPTSTNFKLNSQYLLDQGGDQVTELSGTGGWVHSNVWLGGHLDATYDALGLHFHFADPLGSRRVQTSAIGLIEENIQSLPFGNGLTEIVPPTAPATAADATEHHFTGKERDAESGNDYFGARYYASSMGRFMSPDWSAKEEPVPYAKLDNPQTLNLYAYVGNNPMIHIDADGHCWPQSLCNAVSNATQKVMNGVATGKWVTDAQLAPKPTATPNAPVVPTASLHTDMSGHTTTFTSTNVYGQTKTVQIQTSNAVASDAKPGAGNAFSTPNIGQVGSPHGDTVEMGPKDAYINTGDSRGREIHGGGTGSPDPLGDNQGKWVPTEGCTRGMNADVISLGQAINATRANPEENGATIPYTRE